MIDHNDPLNVGIRLKDKDLYADIKHALADGVRVFLRESKQEQVMRYCTKIVLILDRSGSMASVKDVMEEMLNGYVATQKQQPGDCVMSLVTFDDQYDKVFTSVPIKDVPHIKLCPRGGTALLDAIGRTIDDVGHELRNTPERLRPDKILIVIITDGFENSSLLYKAQAPKPPAATVFDMVTLQRNTYNWEFVFLGADQDAIASACGIGANPGTAINYHNTKRDIYGAGAKLSRMSNIYRSAPSAQIGSDCMKSVAIETNNVVTEKDTKDWESLMQDLKDNLETVKP